MNSVRAIAVRLNRSSSTISREINRNGGYHRYRAARADEEAWNKAKRPKQCKLALNDALCQLVEKKLRLRCLLALQISKTVTNNIMQRLLIWYPVFSRRSS